MPLVPTTVSRITAATVDAPSKTIVSRRWASARSVSCSGEVEWKAERYGYGPQKWTTPTAVGSLAQRRGSPLAVIAAAVEPW